MSRLDARAIASAIGGDPERVSPNGRYNVHARINQEHGAITYTWFRYLSGRVFAFTYVIMADGERRIFVARDNGYIGGRRFACSWSPFRERITPAPLAVCDACADDYLPCDACAVRAGIPISAPVPRLT